MNGARVALIGTISGSNGTSNTAVTGTLVIANKNTNFPSIPADAILLVSGTALITGDVVSSGTLKSNYSAGDEGGEIFFSKPVTNTAINTGVTFDIYQNRFRIFETGGSNRGGYYDITTLGAGVSTNFPIGYAPPITVVTASLTASSDTFLVVKPTSANITITLPGGAIDDTIIVKHGNSSSFDVTINPSGSETIDGQSSYLITTRQCLSLSYENGVWHTR
jgi:hypothetical protein